MATVLDNHPKVLIKRYAGQRLYNTETSTYVSMDDLATMLVSGRRFIVQEGDTGEDVTSDILDRPALRRLIKQSALREGDAARRPPRTFAA